MHILIVDDEKEIVDLVAVYLENEGYTAHKAYAANEAITYIDSASIDLAILDVMLPGKSGFEICKHIRQAHNYPIIMLTAKVEATDKITGLTLGADDYVTKPFLPLELVARVKAQLRRYKRYSNNPQQDNDEICIGGLVLNCKTHECTLNEKVLNLTPTEFSILKILCENKGAVISSDAMFREIWKEDYYTKSNNTITVHIRHIREKMGDSFESPKYIKTVWGVGYKIEG